MKASTSYFFYKNSVTDRMFKYLTYAAWTMFIASIVLIFICKSPAVNAVGASILSISTAFIVNRIFHKENVDSKIDQDDLSIFALSKIYESKNIIDQIKNYYKYAPCYKDNQVFILGEKITFLVTHEKNKGKLFSPYETFTQCKYTNNCIFKKTNEGGPVGASCFSRVDIEQAMSHARNKINSAISILSNTKPSLVDLLTYCQNDFNVIDEWFIVRHINSIEDIHFINDAHLFLIGDDSILCKLKGKIVEYKDYNEITQKYKVYCGSIENNNK